MRRTTPRIVITLFFALSLIIPGSGCKPRRSANEKRYDLKGKVVAVSKSERTATIAPELQEQPHIYAKTHLLTISFDPEYDSPKVLRSYGASHTGRYTDETFQHWEFAGGSADEVKGIAQYFGLRYFHDTESGQDQVLHSLRTVVIGPDGKLFKLYRGNEWKPAEIVNDLQSLAQAVAPAGH